MNCNCSASQHPVCSFNLASAEIVKIKSLLKINCLLAQSRVWAAVTGPARPNTNTRINQLKNGEVHVVALAPWDKYRELAAIPSIVVARTPGNAYEHVTLNERQFPPFADVRVRRALLHALDRERYTKTILDGLAPVAHGPIQPASWAYTDHVTRYRFDPVRARLLLDEAGWQLGSNGIRQREGRPLAFTLITQAGYAIRENVAQAIERQLRDVGVDVRVELHDGTALSALWFEGKFDAMLHWWQMPSDPELTTFFAADRTPGYLDAILAIAGCAVRGAKFEAGARV